MKRHACPLALALVIGLSGVVPVRAAEPTPTPQPKAKRKLGGGSFGQPPTTPTPATGGSSLADAARKAQEEGGAGTQARSARVVITNETLKKPERATGTGTGISISGSAGAKPSVRIPATPGPTPQAMPEYRDASGKTEADWRARANEARTRVERAEADVQAGREEVRRLENDFYAWSDGNYRERVIRPAWDQAKEKLERLELEAEAARTDLAGLEEEARKSGTPPGWLR